jgi:hypothetical protein
MQKRTIKVAILAALAIILLLSFSSVALADQTWSDLPDTVTAKYAITDNQVAAISDGFVGGLWKPFQSVTRAQFTKMAVAAFKIPVADPATASFTDVAKGSTYYQYIEGAKAAGAVNGVTATSFSPNASITRQQAIAIVARYIAKVNGYDLATMYSAAEIDGLLAHFGDKASISAELKKEVAFAFDFGITEGNDAGNVAPLANLTRIQGAAFLIRAEGKIPPANWTAAKIELVTADKSENLIGKVKQVTFKVTDGAGHPAIGVLVDFDTMWASPLYVGNISQQAAMTNNMGEVTINLISTEPGTQRVSAAVSGVAAIYTTAYWVALDQVYITDETREAENNAGTAHEWGARVVVYGPGPLSAGPNDWYNVVDTTADPANLEKDDGYVIGGRWSYSTELGLPAGDVPRTLAGIDVTWSMLFIADDPDTTDDETFASVGKITKVDGVAITPATEAVGKTDADGLSTITIYSELTGTSEVSAVANYAENPYPKLLVNHYATDPDDWDSSDNWNEQPGEFAWATKTWIPHVIGGDSDAPITPLYAVNNTGEVETFVLDLKDVYGNAIPGYTVEWWIQGVGFFKTDGSTWVGIGEQNKDIDVTDAAGEASVTLKSLIPGQTIVHLKVMDKYGLPWKEWNVVKQWYSIDDVTFGHFDDDGFFYADGDDENVVDTGHDWVVAVSGAKYVYSLYDINKNGLRDDQVLIGDRQDLKDAKGMVKDMAGGPDFWKPAGEEILPGQAIYIGDWGKQNGAWYTRFADIQLEDNEFWMDMNEDGVAEVWAGLAGKTVYFFNNVGRGSNPASNTPMETISGDGTPNFVGTITSETPVVTDDMGFATVSINSLNKGNQWVYAVADYKDNPQDGDPLKPLDWAELRWDVAHKLWTHAGGDSTVIFAQGNVVGDRWVNPVLDWTRGEDENPNYDTIAVQVFDTYGNALPDYKVTWEVVGQGTTTAGTQPTYHPFAHFENPAHDASGVGDLNPWVNSNKWIGDFADGVHPQAVPDDADADWAWGHTQNHLINFETGLVSAAHVDLVMDETAGELAARTESHFTNIVNIKVYYPESEGGGVFDEFEVTKVWSLDAPVLTSVVLDQAYDGGDYTMDPIAGWYDSEDFYYRVQLLDQFGNPMANYNPADDKLYFNSDVPGMDWIAYDLGVSDADGYVYWIDYIDWMTGDTTLTFWIDADGDDIIDASELKSNSVLTTVLID